MLDLESIGIASTLLMATFFKMACCARRDHISSIEDRIWTSQYQHKKPDYNNVHRQYPGQRSQSTRETMNWPGNNRNGFPKTRHDATWRPDSYSNWVEWKTNYYYAYLNYFRKLQNRKRVEGDEENWPKGQSSDGRGIDAMRTTKTLQRKPSNKGKEDGSLQSNPKMKMVTKKHQLKTSTKGKPENAKSSTIKVFISQTKLPRIKSPNVHQQLSLKENKTSLQSETKLKLRKVDQEIRSSNAFQENESENAAKKPQHNSSNTNLCVLITIIISFVIVLAGIILCLLASHRKRAAADQKGDAMPAALEDSDNDDTAEDVLYSRGNKDWEKVPLLKDGSEPKLVSPPESISAVPQDFKRKYSGSLEYLAPPGTSLSGPQPSPDYMYERKSLDKSNSGSKDPKESLNRIRSLSKEDSIPSWNPSEQDLSVDFITVSATRHFVQTPKKDTFPSSTSSETVISNIHLDYSECAELPFNKDKVFLSETDTEQYASDSGLRKLMVDAFRNPPSPEVAKEAQDPGAGKSVPSKSLFDRLKNKVRKKSLTDDESVRNSDQLKTKIPSPNKTESDRFVVKETEPSATRMLTTNENPQKLRQDVKQSACLLHKTKPSQNKTNRVAPGNGADPSNKSLERLVSQGTEGRSGTNKSKPRHQRASSFSEDSDDDRQPKPWLKGNVRDYYKLTPDLNEDSVRSGDVKNPEGKGLKAASQRRPRVQEVTLHVSETSHRKHPRPGTSNGQKDSALDDEKKSLQTSKNFHVHAKKITK